MAEGQTPVEIFCSYAHEDEMWLRKLETHLSLLKRQGLISFWHDRLITPGTDWAREIDRHLETASVILLLVSADFLASDYRYGIEMKRALERHQRGEAQVIPILTRPVDWKHAPFTHQRILPTNAQPLATWANEDAALADVVEDLRRVLEGKPLPDPHIQVIFEKSPQYPFLNFSVINRTNRPVQISGIRVVKAASVSDSHDIVAYNTGPRIKLEFALEKVSSGQWTQIFGDDMISNLAPGEAEAFQIRVECTNTVNLLDLEVEFLSSDFERTNIYMPSDVVVIHSPIIIGFGQYEIGSGGIVTITRKQALQALINGEKLDLWSSKEFADCEAWKDLFLRGAGYLCRDSWENGFEVLREQFEGTEDFGPVLASFADLLGQDQFPSVIFKYMCSWICDPQKITSIPNWDTESHARDIFEKLIKAQPSKDRVQFCLEVLDGTLDVQDISDSSTTYSSLLHRVSLHLVREAAIAYLVTNYGLGCVEYLISLLTMQDVATISCAEHLSRLVKQDTHELLESYLMAKLAKFWQDWWLEQKRTSLMMPGLGGWGEDWWLKDRYARLPWRYYSPRLLKALHSEDPATKPDVLSLLAKDEDALIRRAVARNPMTSTSILKTLAEDPIAEVRACVVKNPKCPEEVLQALANDPESAVRNWVHNVQNFKDKFWLP